LHVKKYNSGSTGHRSLVQTLSVGKFRLRRRLLITAVWLMACSWAIPAAAADSVSALGRLEPEGGVLLISAALTPRSISGALVEKLLVKPGDDVEQGQLLAVIDTVNVMQTVVDEAEAEHRLSVEKAALERSRAHAACVDARVAEREAERRQALLERGVTGEEEAESAAGLAESLAASCSAAQAAVNVATAEIELSAARVEHRKAELARSYVYAPVDGRILEIHAWPGEMAAANGLLEMGRVNQMYAIAEVYETDIDQVSAGQKAVISSDALAGELTGTVEKIRQQVAKQDEIGTDPAARKDARIIEVEIRLDDSSAVTGLTHLQVEVLIQP